MSTSETSTSVSPTREESLRELHQHPEPGTRPVDRRRVDRDADYEGLSSGQRRLLVAAASLGARHDRAGIAVDTPVDLCRVDREGDERVPWGELGGLPAAPPNRTLHDAGADVGREIHVGR